MVVVVVAVVVVVVVAAALVVVVVVLELRKPKNLLGLALGTFYKKQK